MNVGSGDGLQSRRCLQRSQSAGETVKKDQKTKRRTKKGRDSAEAEDLFNPTTRKTSFPFQWAWESFVLGGQPLVQPNTHVAVSHRSLLLPPAVPQLKPRRKSTTNLSGDLGFCQKMEVQIPERRRLPRAWGSFVLPVDKVETPGLEPLSLSAGSESEDILELEGQGAEEPEKVLGAGELPQLPDRASILEEEWISEGAEEEDHSAPHRRKEGARKKGRAPGQKAPEEGEPQASSGLQGPQKEKSRAKTLQGPWDLERLHRQLEEELDCGHQKQTWKALRAAVQASAISKKVLALGDEENLQFGNFPNRTFQKRQEATRSQLQAWERQQEEERQQAEIRRAREYRVQQQVAHCLAAYAPQGRRGAVAAQRKLEELRRQERQRFAEYQAELQGIQHRVQARPFLFQQAMQTNARLTATRRFSQVLSALGVDEEELLAEAGNTEGTSRKHRNHHRSVGVEMESSSWSPSKAEHKGRHSSPNPNAEYSP